MPNPNYRFPGVSGTVSSVVQTAVNIGTRIMGLIGTAGSGPDVPTLYNSVAAAAADFGSAGAPGSLPWGIQCAMGSVAAGGTGAPCLIGRVNVTRATAVLLDSAPATWATLLAKGKYAGSPGNALNAVVAAGTLSATRKVTIQAGVGGSAVILSVYDNLKLPADLVAAAMNDPYIDVTPGTSVLLPATATTAFASGADGLTTVPGGNPDLVLAMMSLMFNGSFPAPRYICPLWDANSVYADVQAVIAAAVGDTSNPMPVMAYLGSSLSASIAANASTVTAISTPQIVVWGLPGAMRYDSSVNVLRAFDGFYVAATLMGLKASLPVEQTGIGTALPGWAKNLTILSGGIYRQPTKSDLVALGQNGAAFGVSGYNYNGVQLVDHLTTGPQTGSLQWQAQAAMLDSHHHAQQYAYAAGNSFAGQPAPSNGNLSNSISGTLAGALGQLKGGAIDSINSIATNPDPATVGRYLPQINYNLRQTVRNIDIAYSINFAS